MQPPDRPSGIPSGIPSGLPSLQPSKSQSGISDAAISLICYWKGLHPTSSHKYVKEKQSKHVIDENDTTHTVTITNGNLDGLLKPQQNNFDRVTLHLNLHKNKKALTVLPEEAVKIILAKAKHHDLSQSFPTLIKELATSSSSAEQKECYMDFPPAIALPAWACNHYAIDSLMDACDCHAMLYNPRPMPERAAHTCHVSKRTPIPPQPLPP